MLKCKGVSEKVAPLTGTIKIVSLVLGLWQPSDAIGSGHPFDEKEVSSRSGGSPVCVSLSELLLPLVTD